MATIEEQEVELGDALGDRWWGPVVLVKSHQPNLEGQIRKAWYMNGTLEEVICQGPGSPMVQAEVWPARTNPFLVTR